jgi:hypothetical protein
MYEHKLEPIVTRWTFFARMAAHILIAATVVAVSLIVGTVGYHFLGELSWSDSFLNASMILGGMGPVDPIKETSGKLFASFYALYAGFVLLISVGILVAPVFHRLLHHFHLERKSDDKDS